MVQKSPFFAKTKYLSVPAERELSRGPEVWGPQRTSVYSLLLDHAFLQSFCLSVNANAYELILESCSHALELSPPHTHIDI